MSIICMQFKLQKSHSYILNQTLNKRKYYIVQVILHANQNADIAENNHKDQLGKVVLKNQLFYQKHMAKVQSEYKPTRIFF